MQRLLLLLFFIFFNTLTGYTQAGTFSGKLTFEDGSPVAFATLIIADLKKSTFSDQDGNYEVDNIPYGSYLLDVSSMEIEKTTLRVELNKPSLKFPIVLKKADASLLDEVVVAGETEKQRIESKGFAATVIETGEMAMRSLQTNELLDRAVGVRVRQSGGLGSAVDYNLNGMSGNSVRIFIDGIPISTYGASFSLNSIPPALIERIEVYKGVIPAYLADDALGGAINVVLKQGMRNNIAASVSYGSFNTFQANVSGSFRENKSGFTVKASSFHNYSDNDYEVWGKFVRNIGPDGRPELVRAKRFNDAYRSTGALLELGFTDVKWADQFFIGYNGSSDYKEIQHGTYMSIPYKGRFTESSSHAATLNYRKKNLFVPGLELTMNGVYSKRSQLVNDTVRWNYNWYGEQSIGLHGGPIFRPQGAQQGAPTINHVDRNVSTFRMGLNYEIHPNHRVAFNHSYFDIDRNEQDQMKNAVEREFISTRDLQKNISSFSYEMTVLDSRLKTNVFAKYYQQKIDRMNPKLTEVSGQPVRTEDRVNSNRNTIGYGMALSYAIVSNFMIITSAEKAVRMPSENEIFGSPGDNIVENTGINPEVSNNLNVGFRAGAFRKGNHKFSLSGNGFIRDTRDKIMQQVSNSRINDATQTAPFENAGKVKSIGFEAEVNYSFGKKLNLVVNASKFNSLYNVKYDVNGNVFRNYDKQIPNEPFYTINSTVQYSFNDLISKNSNLRLYYSFGFVESFYISWLHIEDEMTPRQYAQDFGMSYAFPNKKLIISADVKNIFDQQLYDNFAVQKPGRAFYLKLNYSINKF